VKKLARELNFQPEVLQMIIHQGFRPGIKAAVIQKGKLDMDEMIHVAKLAESVEVASNDAMTQKLNDMMKASVEAAQKQATELQALSTKITTMSSKQDSGQNAERRERERDTQTRDNRSAGPRPLRPTPRNQQRISYVRQSNNSQRRRAHFNHRHAKQRAASVVYYTLAAVARHTDSSAEDAAG
jgi:hypothetical protein